MLENWMDAHPWMIFILGVMSLTVLNTFFVSIGGGYKKPPPSKADLDMFKKELEVLFKD